MTKGAVFGAMYKIGELSKICGLPVKTLRYYDHLQLLVPDKIDPFTGYRYYSPAKISVCDRIIALKELGFTLQERKQTPFYKLRISTRAFYISLKSKSSIQGYSRFPLLYGLKCVRFDVVDVVSSSSQCNRYIQ